MQAHAFHLVFVAIDIQASRGVVHQACGSPKGVTSSLSVVPPTCTLVKSWYMLGACGGPQLGFATGTRTRSWPMHPQRYSAQPALTGASAVPFGVADNALQAHALRRCARVDHRGCNLDGSPMQSSVRAC